MDKKLRGSSVHSLLSGPGRVLDIAIKEEDETHDLSLTVYLSGDKGYSAHNMYVTKEDLEELANGILTFLNDYAKK